MSGQKGALDFRRAQILRAGYDVATRVGLEKLTVRLVAAKARLSSGLVHFYFKTKERLLTALLGHVLEAATVPPSAHGIGAIKSPLGRLRALLRREMVRLSSEPRRIRLLFEYWVKGFRHPEIRARMRAEHRRRRDAFRPIAEVVVASEPGEFPQVSAERLATVAVGVIEGAAMQSVIDPGKFDVDEYMATAKRLLEQPR